MRFNKAIVFEHANGFVGLKNWQSNLINMTSTITYWCSNVSLWYERTVGTKYWRYFFMQPVGYDWTQPYMELDIEAMLEAAGG